MPGFRPAAVAAFCLPLLIGACAAPRPVTIAPPPVAPAPEPANAVVLLPAADGSAGRVIVANEAGSRTLDRAGTATRILDARTAPSEPAPMDAAEIARTFGAALAAQPALPLHFILYFEQGSSTLTEVSRREVPAVIAAIRDRASADISVVGHTDTVGDAKMNLELSLRRAIAVGALLAAEGIDPGSLEITSHGKANLLVPTADNVTEPRNRRVEVTVR